ncbi:MAG: HAD family hydrolase [Chloroflexota bacterium]
MPEAVKVISFDLHETLTTPDFITGVWYEAIPLVYARKHDLSLEEAKKKVFAEYKLVSDTTFDYYDLKYWAKRFKLGSYADLLEPVKDRVAYYPETTEVLDALSRKYPLIIATGMPCEFMPPLLSGIQRYFTRTFSSFSDCGQFKCPDFYLTVCREMGVKPPEMVHVGDNWEKDFLMPREVSIKTFHLNRKGKPFRENLQGEPDENTLTDLRQLVERVKDL